MTTPITLPAYLNRKPKKYITRSGGQYTPDDIALRFALCLQIHGTADALRATARELAPKVCYEHQPNMKLLSRTMDDEKVFVAAINIINRVCDLLGLAPDSEFHLIIEDHPDGQIS